MTIWRSLLVAALFLCVLVAAATPARTQLACSGKMPTKVGPAPATAQVILEMRRWGLDSLSESKGFFWVTMPGEVAIRYKILRNYGGLLDINRHDGLNGIFSTASSELAVHTPQGLFVGVCRDAV